MPDEKPLEYIRMKEPHVVVRGTEREVGDVLSVREAGGIETGQGLVADGLAERASEEAWKEFRAKTRAAEARSETPAARRTGGTD